jgi:hypothetical protein
MLLVLFSVVMCRLNDVFFEASTVFALSHSATRSGCLEGAVSSNVLSEHEQPALLLSLQGSDSAACQVFGNVAGVYRLSRTGVPQHMHVLPDARFGFVPWRRAQPTTRSTVVGVLNSLLSRGVV